ncbi:hypothetical protein NC653_041165 [Populus alba x Populus x berolinensis]|uniref:Uncharacterized protein n=1 Tax=Populus alba x Populus x berolinensis TaxID=444605 RepID=A0AAD6L858_9ROSI|nr:hypothetical protein NC653_041165 [Populus alba x Populus x berolinensis]
MVKAFIYRERIFGDLQSQGISAVYTLNYWHENIFTRHSASKSSVFIAAQQLSQHLWRSRPIKEEQNKERFQHNHNLTLFLLTFREGYPLTYQCNKFFISRFVTISNARFLLDAENQNHIGSADICFKRIETSQD